MKPMHFVTPRWLNAPRVPAPENCIWSHLRHAGEPLSISDIVRRTDVEPVIVTHWLRRWKDAGLVTHVGRQSLLKLNGFAMRYVTPPADVALKKLPQRFTPSSMRQRIWTAIRVLKVFDLPMLLIAAEAGMSATLKYLAQLVRGGYVERIDQPGDEHRRYRVILDTGPHHPSVTRVVIDGRPFHRLIDSNTAAQIHWPTDARRAPGIPFFDQER